MKIIGYKLINEISIEELNSNIQHYLGMNAGWTLHGETIITKDASGLPLYYQAMKQVGGQEDVEMSLENFQHHIEKARRLLITE
jgi:hypothetical protein